MPQIRLRDEENLKRKQRVAKLKKGPGVFVYDGTLFDTEWSPTVKLIGQKEPVLDADGMPVLDSQGRQVFQKAGAPARDENGYPVLGGPPKKKRIPIEVYKLRGVEFPKGKPVQVGSVLALKLRGMDGFDEVEADTVKDDASPMRDKNALYKMAVKMGLPVDREMDEAELARIVGDAIGEEIEIEAETAEVEPSTQKKRPGPKPKKKTETEGNAPAI